MEENRQPEINTEMASEEVSAVGEAPEEKKSGTKKLVNDILDIV